MGLGLLTDGINEVIATTDRNAAPMGIICREGTLRMVVYRTSHTAANIEKHGWLVANFLHDPVVYVRTAFEDPGPESFIPEVIDSWKVQRLADTEAWAAFSAVIDRRTTEALMVRLELLQEEILDPVIHPVNRGFSSVIEATVHATRYQVTGDKKYLAWIDHHAGIVRKCGGAREREALAILESFVRDQKKKK